MTKRILTLTLAILMALTVMVMPVTANATNETISEELTDAEKFFIGIGVISDETYRSSAVLTRAEFAEFLVHIANLEVAPGDEEAEAKFVDVPTTHKSFGAINTVHSYGLMSGVGESKFAPDYNIVLNQAVKVIGDLMGYTPHANREGGYPGGYLTVAGKLGLLKKVSGTATEVATYRDVMQMFYNALEVEVQAVTGATDQGIITGPGGETFAEAVLNLKMLEGRVTDNGFTALTGPSNVKEHKMVIADVVVDMTDELSYARDYIGLMVKAYYRTDVESEKPLAYAVPYKNDSLTFDLADFVSITQSKITYYNGNRNVSETLSSGVTMLFNGTVYDPIDPAAFVGLDGDVTLVSVNSGAYDLIIVNSYENIFVESIDKTDKIIYNGIKYNPGFSGTVALDFSDENTYDFLNVITYDGRQSSFDNIREGDVLSAKVSLDGRVITLIDEREFTQTFVLDNYEVIDNVCKLSNGEDTYELLNFDRINLPDLIRGNEYTIHFNKFGYVAWIEMASTEYPIGFLAGAEAKGGEYSKEYSVRIYTMDAEFVTLMVGERVYYNGFKKKTEDIFSELSSYVGVAVLYDSEEGFLTRIVMPEDLGVDSNRGWYRISPVAYGCQEDSGLSDSDWSEHKTSIWSTVGEWRHVGDKFAFVSGESQGMFVPAQKSNYGDDKAYGLFTSSPKSGTKKAIEGYSRDYNDVVADLQLMRVESSGMSSTGMEMILISEITERANDEGEIVKVINGYKTSYGTNGVSKVTYPVAEDVIISGCSMDNISDVAPGDIMMYSVNGNDELTRMEIFYDYSTGRNESMLHSSYYVHKGYAYTSGSNYVRTSSIAPESLDMTDPADYAATRGRHHSYTNSVIIVTDIDGRLFFDTASVSNIKSYTKSNGVYDLVVTISNGSESIFGTVAYR